LVPTPSANVSCNVARNVFEISIVRVYALRRQSATLWVPVISEQEGLTIS
jgi:hypothetical protein